MVLAWTWAAALRAALVRLFDALPTRMPQTSDVLVIGGGPAGSTAACLLAKKGHNVTVLEKERFPREHVGESLLPYCYGLFKKLGVLSNMKKSWVRKPGVRFLDTDGRQFTTWCFGHVLKDPSHLSFHVVRAQFDQMLLNNARDNGVHVREQTKVTKVDLSDPESVTVHAKGPRGGEQVHRARFLIDASGRDTFLAKRHKWKSPHPDLDRSALSTHWLGGKFVGGIDEGLLQICYLGGEKKGWIWVIPVAEGRLSIGVVLNHSYIRKQKAKLQKKGVRDWKRALYVQELQTADFVRDILADARIAQPLMFNGDYSYFVDPDKKWGANYALVGDASAFIDPIFASGVYLSMNTANLVSEALHKRLRGRDNSVAEDAMANAYSKVNGAYRLVDKAIRMFYNPGAINFAQAGSATSIIHSRHEDAMALGHYLLAGDFFDRHQEYSDFIDTLQDPKLFAKYKSFVIDRPDFQATTCHVQRSTVFHSLMEEHRAHAALHPSTPKPTPKNGSGTTAKKPRKKKAGKSAAKSVARRAR